MDSIDAVDYGILTCVSTHENGVWKKQAHEWLQEHADELPEQPCVSLQTVGRRIHQLTEDNLLETKITSTSAVSRDMIITYHLTGTGQTALDRKRQLYLQDYIKDSTDRFLFDDSDTEPEDAVIIRLLRDEFGIDDAVRNSLFTTCDPDELVALLYAHYVLANIDDVIQPEHEPVLTEILHLTPELRAPFERDTVIHRMRRRLSAAAVVSSRTDTAGQPSPIRTVRSPHRRNKHESRGCDPFDGKRWQTP